MILMHRWYPLALMSGEIGGVNNNWVTVCFPHRTNNNTGQHKTVFVHLVYNKEVKADR